MNKDSSLKLSESNEKHDFIIENGIKFDFSSWSRVSDKDSESRLPIFSVDEKDESLDLISLMWLEE